MFGVARFYDVYVLGIFILGNKRRDGSQVWKKFGDQAIDVEEKTSGAVEPANLPKDWCRTRSRSDRELKFAVPTLSREFEFARDQDR
jgi:hypothetical protein